MSAQYASIPRTPDGRGVQNLLNAVAPGGTLLVVSHDLAPMRTPIDTTTTAGRSTPTPIYESRISRLRSPITGWHIEVHEKRPRPPGAASGAHHVDDVVFRAHRRTS